MLKTTNVHKVVQEAVSNSTCLNIDSKVSEIKDEYSRRAVGPAASEVLERGISELNQLSDTLKNIPGQPRNIKHKSRTNKIKLYWDPHHENPEAVDEYAVFKRRGIHRE